MKNTHVKLKNPKYNNIETVVFDFGNVLIDIDTNLTIEAFNKLKVENLNPLDIHPNNRGIFLKTELGEASTADFVTEIRQKCVEPDKISDRQILDAWNALLLPFDYSRFELVNRLKQTYNVILLSNTNEAHHIYFEAKFNAENPWRMDFKSLFDHVFYSDELGLRKPEVEIYQKVMQVANLVPEKTLFIDDNAPNLVAPQALGWHTYHLVKPETVLDLFQEQ